ncbi:hypothetical protein [Pseudomonas sp. GD03944]|uniref:hypothetical protein n=1 Tax=Pseudomonas sp. GD03944 TaxID=2975409 RepID=UPI00244C48BD|nr:hypothetical protein [Pseudomonas sp. GD03944]MDH1265135.1 hypothetical protein [Pseudomonas sp. GD03944]
MTSIDGTPDRQPERSDLSADVHLQPPFVRPSRRRAPFFDGMEEERASLTFACVDCTTPLTLNVLGFIGQASDWFPALAEPARVRIATLFGCRIEARDGASWVMSHDAGHPYFGLVECTACRRAYLLYLSFYEHQPARYIATFQGAARVGGTEPRPV